MNNVEDTVKKIIADQLGLNVSDITPEKRFIDDLGADSLDTVELILTLEDIYNVEIAEEDAEGIDTVQKIVDFVKQLKS